MIFTVELTSIVSTDTTISHKTEVIVDTQEEARERGAEFMRMMTAFNEGIGEALPNDS